jgi:hypothetical protein
VQNKGRAPFSSSPTFWTTEKLVASLFRALSLRTAF